MALQKLIGGPDWDVVTNPDSALFADFHYFILSGSTERSNPWNSPSTPIAKVLNVTNITANSVVANYVSSSGQLTNIILTSGSTQQITAQTIPLGLDNTAWLSASIVSDFTGSVTARTTGSRWFELESIRSISQDTYVYTIADGSNTITRTNTGQPSVGSLRYRCSRTIPYLDNGWWIIRDLYDCTGGTTTTTTTTTSTTTTTLAPTTTTTTVAPFCTVWTASNAFGAGYEIRVKYCGDTSYSFPTVPANSSIYVCVQNNQIDNNGNPITLTSSSVACTGSIITTTTTTSTTTTTTSTTTTTAAPTTTTTTAPPFSYITASVTGAAASGQYVSGGFTWQYYEFYSASSYSPSFTVLSGYDTGSKLLLVGAGGSGGASGKDGGGGGGGQVIYVNNFTLASGSNYNLTLPGYAAGVTSTQGINGGAAIGFGYTANGGGGGGGTFPDGEGRSVTGGSGGGGNEGELGGTGTFSGGNSSIGSAGGGGGGASSNGSNTAGSIAGNGGAGLTFTINGSPLSVAGGGGGGTSNNVAAATGADGGGTGATFDTNSSNGQLGTGAGGGGGIGPSDVASGEGGSGRIVIAYKIPPATTTTSTSTTTTLASQKYYVESCDGPGSIVGVITITNAPTLTAGQIIRLDTSVAGLSCFQVYTTSTGTPTLGTRGVTNIYGDCVDCTD